MKNILFIIITLLLIQRVHTQRIQVRGEWTGTIPVTNITEAGEDFTGIYTSSVNQVYLDVDHPAGWIVSVQKNNIVWNNEIEIFTRRTGAGIGIGTIFLGATARLITDFETIFISGSLRRTDIPLQFRLRNVSVTIPAGNYVVEIMYTLTNN